MRKIQTFIVVILALLLLVRAAPVQAQDYSFQVSRQTVILYVNSDGTISLDYTITFNNNPGAAVIDIVDIGMPNSLYSRSSISAEINGSRLTDIRTSTVVSPGVEIHLGSNSIQPGQSGTLHVYVGTVEGAIGKSTLEEAEDYASIVFTPNYFDRRFVTGSTDFTMTIVLPPGMNSEEPRYHTPSNNWPGAEEPSASFDEQGRVVYTWYAPEANNYSIYRFGASFPARLVPTTAIVATETPNPRTIDTEGLFGVICAGGIMCMVILFPFLGVISSRKRRLQYLPPKISVEGHGIKRGLTAVEAGILMEQPLDKVMTMILFSTLKKGAATVLTRDPLKLDVVSPLPAGLLPYEISFLEAFKQTKDAQRKTDLQNTMVALVKSVSEKMKGFSRKETIDYYRTIMEKAWGQVTAAGTPEVKSETYEQVMDWTMLDKKWEGRTQETFGSGPVIVPTWWWRYDPVIRSSGGGGGFAKPSAPGMPQTGGSISVPKLPGSDFAASMVGGVQNFSSKVIGDLGSFTSSITDRTNPVPKTTSSGGRSGGGGGSSCACACACAGCACACAGGGR